MFFIGMVVGIFFTAILLSCLILSGKIDDVDESLYSYKELVEIKDYLLKENEKLKEELNNKLMDDYSHSVDESWYRELYEDFKSRVYETIKFLEHQDVELEEIAVVDDGTYSVAKETIQKSKYILKGHKEEENKEGEN